MESEALEHAGTKKAENPSRRSALAIVVAGATALCSGAIGLVVGFLSNALGRRPARTWIRIGPAEDLDSETFQTHVLRVEQRHAWILERRPLAVYVKDLYPEDPVVLLSTCTHLGCAVKWDAAGDRFACPCHGGVYDAQGRVIAGPPPRPLTRLEVKIEDDICFVRLPEQGGRSSATDVNSEGASA